MRALQSRTGLEWHPEAQAQNPGAKELAAVAAPWCPTWRCAQSQPAQKQHHQPLLVRDAAPTSKQNPRLT